MNNITAENKISFASCLRILLGVVLLSEFFTLWDQHFFTQAGFIQKLTVLQGHSFFAFSHYLLSFFASAAAIFSILSAIVLLLTAVALLCGVFTPFALAAAIAVFAIYFIAHAGTAGTWVFEFVMPLGFIILLASYKPFRKAFVGDLHGASCLKTIVMAAVVSVLTAFAIVLSKNSAHAQTVGIITAAVIFVLLLVNYGLSQKTEKSLPYDLGNDVLLRDKATIFIGLMLSSQVHMNHLINWFTAQGYTNLINIYQHYSTLSPNLHFFTQMIKSNVTIAMPIQASLESFLAICLVLLVFRPISYWLAAIMFLGLAVIEFGVPATFPVRHPVEYTWTWELLLSTCVMAIIGIYEIKRLCKTQGCLARLVGTAVFQDLSATKRFIFSFLIAAGMFLVVWGSHNLAKVSIIFSLESALTAFFYLLLFHLVDLLRLKSQSQLELN